jgi:hypothetical protein
VEIVDDEGVGVSALRGTGEMGMVDGQIFMAVDEVAGLF